MMSVFNCCEVKRKQKSCDKVCAGNFEDHVTDQWEWHYDVSAVFNEQL